MTPNQQEASSVELPEPASPTKFPPIFVAEAGCFLDFSVFIRERIEDRDAQWRAYAAAKVLEALEEACAKCEAIADDYARTEGRRSPELKSDAETGAKVCEDAINALKDKKP